MTAVDDKIRKLMALANHPGTGAAEAATAAAMAAELALKYNLDLAAVQEATPEQRKTFKHGDYATSALPRDKAAHMLLARGVADLYGCKFLILTMHNSNKIKFVGQEHNIMLCNSWLQYLMTAMSKSTAAYLKTRMFSDNKEKYRADGQFRLMFAHEVRQRLAEKLEQMRRHGVSGSTGTAIMVVNWYDQERKEVQAWLDQNMGKLRQSNTRKKSIVDVHAATHGVMAGKQVSLSDQIANPHKPHHTAIGQS